MHRVALLLNQNAELTEIGGMRMPFRGDNSELNPLILEIAKLAAMGMSDRQIASLTGKNRNTILQYRRFYGIEAGYKRAEGSRKKPEKEPKPRFKALNKLYL